MNVLLVQPEFPVTYWGIQHALPITGRKVALPPLGLISVAALLPMAWRLRLVDLNAEPLSEAHLAWADAVLTGGMRVQAESMQTVVDRARAAGLPVAVGGPAVTTDPDLVTGADVVFLGEAEGRIDPLVVAIEECVAARALAAWPAGTSRPAPIRLAPEGPAYPEMDEVPTPRFDLLDTRQYISVSIQYSRGCPFACEFCDVIAIFGRRPRVKRPEQVLAELDALFRQGYRGTLFFVDDNFIGNRKAVRALLPELARWQAVHRYPFELYTEASIDLASDEALMSQMVAAGFGSVFVGIETPSKEALEGAGKSQNLRLDLVEAVDRITRRGIEVMAGFIVGFDSDGPQACEAQRAFISSLPIPVAMTGLLTAMPGTALWRRLEKEGRLRRGATGDQFGRPNFEPAMDEADLLSGYARLMAALYDPDAYYDRCHAYLSRTAPPQAARSVRPGGVRTLLRSIWAIGVRSPRRWRYWRLLAHALRRPGSMSWAVAHAIMGEHFIRYTREEVLPRIDGALADVARERAAAPRPAPRLAVAAG